ncbi:hypothetical protein DM02DRAFT_514060 [Periconia macrospinosa]|uniref:F-box domain-containing protein n=1 Tax=Periconia macrospinosa TaxID=97972 RepID=A0A2V1E937_9PLEO|nr:hypothetical protein DM02DRAFT_514060 [Periconia macrospinosa]
MAHTTSAEDYQELGKTYYKKKQYDKALSAFKSAIEASDVPTVSLYDYCAACHEKLADFAAAVKDGREAIRANKRDVRGYLRTGSVLQKMNKLDTALGIYKYGMNNVRGDNNAYQFLQKAHDNLTRKLSPPKSVDPFTVLPVELVELILAYLPFRNIVNMLRVSRGWKNYITKRPNLWHEIDLSEATKLVSRGFVNKAVNYAERDVTKFVVHRFQHTEMLKNIATACKGLRELEVISQPVMLSETLIAIAERAASLRKLVVKTDITLDTIAQILHYRPTLEHIEFHSVISASRVPYNYEWTGPFPLLHTVKLSGDAMRPLQRVWGEALVQQTPNLRNLTFGSMTSGGPPAGMIPDPFPYFTPPALLTSLELKRVSIFFFPPLPSTLQRLLDTSNFIPTAGPVNIHPWQNALTSHLPHLTHLSLHHMHSLNPTFLQILLDHHADSDNPSSTIRTTGENGGAPLEHLSLTGVLHPEISTALFAADGLLSASPRILTPALHSLRVPALPCTDNDIEELVTTRAKAVKALRTVDVSATKISGASLKMLVDAAPQLQYIKADSCLNVSSRDAVDYVQGKGVGVSCKMNEGSVGLGGKKVRYG